MVLWNEMQWLGNDQDVIVDIRKWDSIAIGRNYCKISTFWINETFKDDRSINWLNISEFEIKDLLAYWIWNIEMEFCNDQSVTVDTGKWNAIATEIAIWWKNSDFDNVSMHLCKDLSKSILICWSNEADIISRQKDVRTGGRSCGRMYK